MERWRIDCRPALRSRTSHASRHGRRSRAPVSAYPQRVDQCHLELAVGEGVRIVLAFIGTASLLGRLDADGEGTDCDEVEVSGGWWWGVASRLVLGSHCHGAGVWGQDLGLCQDPGRTFATPSNPAAALTGRFDYSPMHRLLDTQKVTRRPQLGGNWAWELAAGTEASRGSQSDRCHSGRATVRLHRSGSVCVKVPVSRHGRSSAAAFPWAVSLPSSGLHSLRRNPTIDWMSVAIRCFFDRFAVRSRTPVGRCGEMADALDLKSKDR